MKNNPIFLLLLLWSVGLRGVFCQTPGLNSKTPDHFLETEGGKLFYEVRGQGQPIVFLHDGLLHSESWSSQWEFFAHDHKVIRYDRRGFGKSENGMRPYSDVEDLRSLLQHLDVSNIVLVGCSAGGSLAINFALKYPALVNRLVLVGPIVSGFGFSEHFQNRNRALLLPLQEGDVPGAISNLVNDPWLIASANNPAKARLRELLSSNHQNLTHPDGFRKPSDPSTLRRFSELRIHTLILVGEDDIPDVHAHCGAIQAGIAQSKRTVVSGAGHLIFLEKSEQFNQLVSKFLSQQ